MKKLIALAALVAAPLSVSASNCGYAAAVVAQAYVAPVAYVVQPAQAVVQVQAYTAPVVQQQVAVQQYAAAVVAPVVANVYAQPVVAVQAVHAHRAAVVVKSQKVIQRRGLFNRSVTIIR